MADAAEVTVGPKGRLVVPSALRRELGIEPGTVLVARIEDARLVLESRTAVLARLRGRYASVPPGVSLVDDLVAERREEAARDAGP